MSKFYGTVDNNKKGGDIDLYILTTNKENITYKRLITKVKLKEYLFKAVDLIISNENKTLIDKEALMGIEII